MCSKETEIRELCQSIGVHTHSLEHTRMYTRHIFPDSKKWKQRLLCTRNATRGKRARHHIHWDAGKTTFRPIDCNVQLSRCGEIHHTRLAACKAHSNAGHPRYRFQSFSTNYCSELMLWKHTKWMMQQHIVGVNQELLRCKIYTENFELTLLNHSPKNRLSSNIVFLNF